MKSFLRSVAIMAVLALLATPVLTLAKSGPGPVVLTFMERVEYHSDTTGVTNAVGEEAFLYSLISAYRQLDKDVFGNIYYLHKYSLDETDTAANIGGVSLTHNMTGKWKMSYSYSYNSNPERGTVASIVERSDNDRLSFSLTHKVNPGRQHKRHYTLKTTYSTGTDFSSSRTLSEKVAVKGPLTGSINYNLSYQFVWGLTDAPQDSIYRSHYANQWSVDLSYKMSKLQRIVLGYLFLDNQYHGARADDNIVRLSYFRSFKR